MKLRPLAVAMFLVFIGMAPSNSSTIPDEQWRMNTDGSTSGQELFGVRFQDNSSLPASVLIGIDNTITNEPEEFRSRTCTGLEDIFCTGNKVHFEAILPPCSNSITMNCIQSFSASNTEGTQFQGVYSESLPKQGWTDFSGDESRKLPFGSTPSLWEIPSVVHGGKGNKYSVTVKVSGDSDSTGQFSIGYYSASISPVTIVDDSKYRRPHHKDSRTRPAGYPECLKLQMACGMHFEGGDYPECASIDDGKCARKEKFPDNYRFQISLKLSNSPTGWFHGRMADPHINLQKATTGVVAKFDALPVTVPALGVLKPIETIQQNIVKNYSDNRAPGCCLFWGGLGKNGLSNRLVQPLPDTAEAFTTFNLWKSEFADQASASPTVWSIRSLGDLGNANSCFTDRSVFSGVVSTNSMIYSPGPPTYNAATATLDYKVASPHLKSSGDVFLGTYDLLINSAVARCVYQFSNAPISASVTIIDSDTGAEKISTYSLAENDGWLKLSVNGFTFSTPTLRVKLYQNALSQSNPGKDAPVDSVRSEKSSSPKSKRTKSSGVLVQKQITCKKGKSLKKVTGSQPDCPKGYTKIATKNLGVSSKSGVKTIWCLKDNEAFEVAGKNPECPDGFAKS